MTESKTPIFDALHKLHGEIYSWSAGRKFNDQRAENGARMRRAISWLKCYEECTPNKIDERFLFLWISFNAAYSKHDDRRPLGEKKYESEKIEDFLHAVVEHDKKFRLAKILTAHQDDVKEITGKEFLYREYWKERTPADWENIRSGEDGLDETLLQVCDAFTRRTLTKAGVNLVLSHTFKRIYILRNQIFHGAATYEGSYNRSSVKPGGVILGACIPAILNIMFEAMKKYPDMKEWGKVEYPPHLTAPDPINPDPPNRNY